jgi:ADP-ribose pyrophosphatase YjhB (NUDIX family)
MSKTYKIGTGCGVMIMKDNKILLGKRHDDPEKADSELHGDGQWCIPGGKLDFKETFTKAVKREAKEETDIDVEEVELVSLCSDIVEDAHFVTAGFISTKFHGEPKVMEPDEIVKWEWFDVNDLPTPMYDPSHKVIKQYLSKVIFEKGN